MKNRIGRLSAGHFFLAVDFFFDLGFDFDARDAALGLADFLPPDFEPKIAS
jgi:hypothetical protein